MLNILNYNNNQIRMLEKDGEYYWVAGDGCKVLKLTNITKALERVDKDDLTKSKVIDELGREQQSYIINESGLYSLVLTSEKEEAKIFKRWITKEVLPQLRKTGKYEIADADKNPVVKKNLTTQPQLNQINLNEINYKKYIDFFKKHFNNYIVQLLYVKMFIKNKIFMLGVSRNIQILDIIFHTVIEQHQAPTI